MDKKEINVNVNRIKPFIATNPEQQPEPQDQTPPAPTPPQQADQKDNFESRLCDQNKRLYIVETFYMSQINPKEFVHNTAYSV